MDLIEKQIAISKLPNDQDIFSHFQEVVQSNLNRDEIPVRFAITDMSEFEYQCDFATLSGVDTDLFEKTNSIFKFIPRTIERWILLMLFSLSRLELVLR